MTTPSTPSELINYLRETFRGTGMTLKGFHKNDPLENTNELPQWSVLFQRMYRYHDLCTLELCGAVAEGGKGVAHLMVEQKHHEALSIGYRLAGLAVDVADPKNGKMKSLPLPVIADELGALSADLLILFWAFATKEERIALLEGPLTDNPPNELHRTALIEAPPLAVLDPNGDLAGELEEMVAEAPINTAHFKRMIYPPLHAATAYGDRVQETALFEILKK